MWKIFKGFQNGYLLQASEYKSGIELAKRKEQAHEKTKEQKNANECSSFYPKCAGKTQAAKTKARYEFYSPWHREIGMEIM